MRHSNAEESQLLLCKSDPVMCACVCIFICARISACITRLVRHVHSLFLVHTSTALLLSVISTSGACKTSVQPALTPYSAPKQVLQEGQQPLWCSAACNQVAHGLAQVAAAGLLPAHGLPPALTLHWQLIHGCAVSSPQVRPSSVMHLTTLHASWHLRNNQSCGFCAVTLQAGSRSHLCVIMPRE